MPFFELTHEDTRSHARTGIMHTDHGDVQTPIFMPVGTQATVKTLDSSDIEHIDAQIILGNTYHLHLRPGEDLIAEHGGLHAFMNWQKPILTDSGGFQVFSLGLQKNKHANTVISNEVRNLDSLPTGQTGSSAHGLARNDKTSQARLVSIDEDGVTFTSHIDGSTHRFTPESAIEIEHKLGADIIMAFDECTPDDADFAYTHAAMERTHRWAERSLEAHRRLQPVIPAQVGIQKATADVRQDNKSYHRFLFGIIQGSVHKELREQSAKFISSLDFDGIAVGGESIGYNMEATADILDWVYPFIPKNKPHYAMGVGLNPTDLLIAIEHGVDMFDCVAPTRIARHGMLFTKNKSTHHRLNIRNATFTKDIRPVDEWCDCTTCMHYSRSYLHHLFSTDEITGMRLASIHNLRFMLKLMEETRTAINEDRFAEYKSQWL